MSLSFWFTKTGFYDDFSRDFDRTRQRPWEEFPFLEKEIGENILDIGCGNGRLLDFLKKKREEKFSYLGIDASAGLLQHAQEKHPSHHFEQSRMENLSLKKKKFDTIISIAAFHHITNKKLRQKTLRDFFSLLESQGKLILTTWNISEDRYPLAFENAKKRAHFLPWWKENDLVIPFGKEKNLRYYHLFSEQELRSLVEKSGFTIKECFSLWDGKKASGKKGKNLCLIAQKKCESPHEKKRLEKRISLLGVPFDAVTFSEALERMHALSWSKGFSFGITPNPEILLESRQNAPFKKILQEADLSIADGAGILWAAQVLKEKRRISHIYPFFSLFSFFLGKRISPLPERVCGSDLFRAFCESSSEKIFLLGGASGAAKFCQKQFSSVVGWDEGSAQKYDAKRIQKKIQTSGATVLFVAFGAPKQEEWIWNFARDIPSLRFAMGVGGSFDFVAGKQKRAPKLFQKLGLEWIWRLLIEPKKRGGRILRAVITFPRVIASVIS